MNSLLFSYIASTCVGVFMVASAVAQNSPQKLDVVHFGPSQPKPLEREWEGRKVTTYRGTIRQLDADELIIVQEDGEVRRVESDRIELVSPVWENEQVVAAQQLFEQRQYKQAIESLGQAVRSGVPRWQQRFLIAQMVQAAEALGNPRTAGILFANLADSQPPALLYADMPLCWTTREVPAVLSESAEGWIEAESDVEKLMGASWLLFSAQSERARRILIELQSSSNTVIAQLAVAQSWRTVPPPKTLESLSGWLEYRETLIPPLRLGPTEFLADRLIRIGEPDLAFGQLIHIANEHADRYYRASRALQTAKMLLEREGNVDEAKRLNPWIEKLEQASPE